MGTYLLDFGPFTYVCGEDISLCGITIAWITSNNPAFVDCDSEVACNNYPNGQCTTIEECFPISGSPPAIMATKTVEIVNNDSDDGDDLADSGENLKYTIEITNSGTVEATNVIFSDDITSLPITYIDNSLSTTKGSEDDNNDPILTVDIGTIAPEETVTVMFEVTVDGSLSTDVFEICNQGEVTYDELEGVRLTDDPTKDGCLDPTCVMVDNSRPILKAEKTAEIKPENDKDSDGLADSGDIISYTITIYNVGSGDAPDVIFTDQLNPNTTLEIGSVQVSPNVGNILEGNGVDDIFVYILAIPIDAGESVTITFDVVVNEITIFDNIDEICNQGFLTGNFSNEPNDRGLPTDDPNSFGGTDMDETCVQVDPKEPFIVAEKTAAILIDQDEDGFADLGDRIKYTVTLTNTGEIAAEDLIFRDDIATTEFVAGSVTTGSGAIQLGNNINVDTEVFINGIFIPKDGSVTIMFETLVNDFFVVNNLSEVCNQGYVDGTFSNNPKGIANLRGLLTNDPTSDLPGDFLKPTCVPTDFPDPIEELPAMKPWSLLLMGVLILGAGLFLLGRSRLQNS